MKGCPAIDAFARLVVPVAAIPAHRIAVFHIRQALLTDALVDRFNAERSICRFEAVMAQIRD